jgi:phospholipase/carboxylesterase
MTSLYHYTHVSSKPGPTEKLVVFIHGYVASGENLLSLSLYWQDFLPPTLFVATNAPEPCEINTLGFQWFGLPDLSPTNIRSGLDKAGPFFADYLQKLMMSYQLSPQDVALVGFSQGAMLALDIIFLIPTLAGVIGYSGLFLPPKNILPTPPKTKVLLVHGTFDSVVPYTALLHAEPVLKSFGISVQTHTCHGLDHSINEEGIKLGGEFLRQVLVSRNSFKEGNPFYGS